MPEENLIPYEGEVPFGYELYYTIGYDKDGNEQLIPQLKECEWTPEEKIKQRVIYLRIKLIDGTITSEEKEELKLLI